MEPDLTNEYIPGDEQYQQGIASLNEPLFLPEGNMNFPIKEIAQNTAKNLTRNYLLKKAGLEGVARNVVGSTLFGGITGLNPFGMMLGTTLPNPIQGIAAYLRNKRAEKEYRRNERMMESNVLSQELARQAAETAAASGPGGGRDAAMGGGSIPTKSSPPKSSGATSNPYSGGAGGVQSGL